ncbi:hypothetical protein WICPIJ_000674 [Wickerhamomyces pijperi]|uniref:SRP9 domain-containing protein n=1 Tax=Wickerhamomyces pijperi TaxID=599730 RepID=A0A9P8TRF6_WICPI|nr:hypothetical protein WICPIJ_000674 [Wickerhamomyces pijperi]
MPIVTNLDTFLHRSHDLIQLNPSNIRISITYGSQSKKTQQKRQSSKVEKPAIEGDNKSFIAVKVYNDHTGELYKYQTGKVKDLSKLMTALGPYGVQVEQRQDSVQDKDNESEKLSLRGFGSVLANVDYKEEDESVEQQQQGGTSDQSKTSTTAAPNSAETEQSSTKTGSSKKNKKKKGKK